MNSPRVLSLVPLSLFKWVTTRSPESQAKCQFPQSDPHIALHNPCSVLSHLSAFTNNFHGILWNSWSILSKTPYLSSKCSLHLHAQSLALPRTTTSTVTQSSGGYFPQTRHTTRPTGGVQVIFAFYSCFHTILPPSSLKATQLLISYHSLSLTIAAIYFHSIVIK